MVKRRLLGIVVPVLIVVAGGISFDGLGAFVPSAGHSISTNTKMANQSLNESAWTVNEETATAGPWTGRFSMRYKPAKPLIVGHRSIARFDVVYSEELDYRGMFPPTLLNWPDVVEWPKGQGGASQGPPIKPMRLKLGNFVYANYRVVDPDMRISATQLNKAFDTATFDISWRGVGAFPPTQLWNVGPIHNRIITFKTSLSDHQG